MKAVVLINRAKEQAADVEQALLAAGLEVSLEQVPGGRIAARASAAVKDGARLVIVGGGDGSVGAAAGALADTKAALGILPMGTLNHFARDLHIPFGLTEAAQAIAKGRATRVDLAEVNRRAFVNNAAIGLYPLMVVDRESQRKRLGRSKRLAMLVASLRTMARFHASRLTLSIDGGEARVDTPLLFVGNNAYRLSLPRAGRRESLDSGDLSVMVMRSKSLTGFLAATVRALAGLSRDDVMVQLDDVRRLKVDSRQQRLPIAIDGEQAELVTPLLFRIRPKALRVVVPR